MTESIVTVDPCTAARMLEIANELRSSGLVQGQDFDFAYRPNQVINLFEDRTPFAEFTFYTDSLATWFRLKYVQS